MLLVCQPMMILTYLCLQASTTVITRCAAESALYTQTVAVQNVNSPVTATPFSVPTAGNTIYASTSARRPGADTLPADSSTSTPKYPSEVVFSGILVADPDRGTELIRVTITVSMRCCLCVANARLLW